MSTTQKFTQVTTVTVIIYMDGKVHTAYMFLECFEACQVSELKLLTFDQMKPIYTRYKNRHGTPNFWHRGDDFKARHSQFSTWGLKGLGSAGTAFHRPLYQSLVVQNHSSLDFGVCFWSWIIQIHACASSCILFYTSVLQCPANACNKA